MLLGWVNENHTYGMERNFTDRIETTFPQLLGATTMTCGLDWNLLVMQSPLKPREAGEYSGSPDPGLTGWELSWGCTFMMRKTNMDYKELIDILQDESNPNVLDYIDDAVTAINDRSCCEVYEVVANSRKEEKRWKGSPVREQGKKLIG